MAKLGEVFTIASGGTPDKGNPFYYEMVQYHGLKQVI